VARAIARNGTPSSARRTAMASTLYINSFQSLSSCRVSIVTFFMDFQGLAVEFDRYGRSDEPGIRPGGQSTGF